MCELAFGEGWYTSSASVGKTSFGFVVARGLSSTYTGQLDVVTPGKWWFRQTGQFRTDWQEQATADWNRQLVLVELDFKQGPRRRAARQVGCDLQGHRGGGNEQGCLLRHQNRLHADVGTTDAAQLFADRPDVWDGF